VFCGQDVPFHCRAGLFEDSAVNGGSRKAPVPVEQRALFKRQRLRQGP
jgi:hypothetical protein